MKIGVPKEIKNNEFRVALTPAGAKALCKQGHEVWVQKTAGDGSNFSDEEYLKSGAKMAKNAKEVYDKAELIVKVKEPLKEEYTLIKPHHTLFTYFHFAASIELTQAMQKSKAICIAYETVEKADGSLPLLIPMSEIAGKMSVQQAAKFLEKPMGGRGVLLGGVPGVSPANVVVLGGGIVGVNAALMAAGLGANVKILDVNIARLRQLSTYLPSNINTLVASEDNIQALLPLADLVIGAVLIPGAKAPKLLMKNDLKKMKKGSVLVDVAIDQGGCFETSKVTTHANPVYEVDGILHYCVANMPGAVPYTSTMALTNVTFPYLLQLANLGWEKACDVNPELKKGLNIAKGKIIYPLF